MNDDAAALAIQLDTLSRRVTQLEATLRGLTMERRRCLLDEVNALEAAVDVSPRTSELRKMARATDVRSGMSR